MQPSRQHDGSRVVAIGDIPSDRYHYPLSSADVARELVGDSMLAVTPDVACYRDVYGGITTLQYESRIALTEQGLRAVVAGLTQ